MARGNRSSRPSSARTTATANDPLRSLLDVSISEPFLAPLRPFSNPLIEVEDGRRWDPLEVRVPLSITGNRTWSIVRAPKRVIHSRPLIAREYYTNIPIGFQLPVGIKRTGMFPVVTCVRRAIRKSVLFATGRTRKGSGAKRRRRSYSSHVGC